MLVKEVSRGASENEAMCPLMDTSGWTGSTLKAKEETGTRTTTTLQDNNQVQQEQRESPGLTGKMYQRSNNQPQDALEKVRCLNSSRNVSFAHRSSLSGRRADDLIFFGDVTNSPPVKFSGLEWRMHLNLCHYDERLPLLARPIERERRDKCQPRTNYYLNGPLPLSLSLRSSCVQRPQ